MIAVISGNDPDRTRSLLRLNALGLNSQSFHWLVGLLCPGLDTHGMTVWD